MRFALVTTGRCFIPITLEMASHIGGHGDAVETLSRMRSYACPKHEDEHHRAKEGGPTGH